MYGMVNRALEQMVRANLGEDVWSRIKDRAGVDVETFSAFTSYERPPSWR